MSRPRRLPAFSYVGCHQYFLTICAYKRRPVFAEGAVAAHALLEFRRTAAREGFVILAYCMMPDHVHLLVEGTQDRSDLCRFVRTAKRQSSYAYARTHGAALWQEGYHDRVLRQADDARALARYILNNPVRAGLARSPEEYPHLGSDVWLLRELLDSI